MEKSHFLHFTQCMLSYLWLTPNKMHGTTIFQIIKLTAFLIFIVAMLDFHRPHAVKSKKFMESSETSLSGQVISDTSGTRRLSCAMKCLQTENCTVFLYGKHNPDSNERYKQITQCNNCTHKIRKGPFCHLKKSQCSIY